MLRPRCWLGRNTDAPAPFLQHPAMAGEGLARPFPCAIFGEVVLSPLGKGGRERGISAALQSPRQSATVLGQSHHPSITQACGFGLNNPACKGGCVPALSAVPCRSLPPKMLSLVRNAIIAEDGLPLFDCIRRLTIKGWCGVENGWRSWGHLGVTNSAGNTTGGGTMPIASVCRRR
jgi:hypothetical protein